MNKHHNHRRKGVVLPFKRPTPKCSPCQAAAQAKKTGSRRGRIDLPEKRKDEQPAPPPCCTFTLHRGDTIDLDGNTLIEGGFYVMIGCDNGSIDVLGPITTLEQAERLAERIAEENGFRFVPDNGIIAQVEREQGGSE